jgi:hypothetical protein
MTEDTKVHDAIAEGIAKELKATHSKIEMVGEGWYSWQFSTYIEKSLGVPKGSAHRYQTFYIHLFDGKLKFHDRIQHSTDTKIEVNLADPNLIEILQNFLTSNNIKPNRHLTNE